MCVCVCGCVWLHPTVVSVVAVAAVARVITLAQPAKTQKSINNLNVSEGLSPDLINVSIHCYDFILL